MRRRYRRNADAERRNLERQLAAGDTAIAHPLAVLLARQSDLEALESLASYPAALEVLVGVLLRDENLLALRRLEDEGRFLPTPHRRPPRNVITESRVNLARKLLAQGPSMFLAIPQGREEPVAMRSEGRFGEVRTGEREGEEAVISYQLGGGFGARVPLSDVVAVGDEAKKILEASGGWRVAKFGSEWFGEGNEVEAWIFGPSRNGTYTWNGWANPYMTESQVEAWMVQQNRHMGEEEGALSWEEEGGDDLLVYTDPSYPDEPSRLPSEWVKGANAPGERVWGVSLGLTWSEERED